MTTDRRRSSATGPSRQAPSLKYAVVERERRFLVRALPSGVTRTSTIRDVYVTGTRLRLREVVEADGHVIRKLNHKVRLTEGPQEVACTSVYVDDAEWAVLAALPGLSLEKRRHHVERDGLHVVVDEFADGTLVAEIDDGDRAPVQIPDWLDVARDVSLDEEWTGARIAERTAPPG
jgi:CYTH domain-containing protein